MQSEAIEQFHFVSPMMAQGATSVQIGGAVGLVAGAALAAGVAAVTVDLMSLPAVPADWPASSKNIAPNVLGRFMDLTAEGGDVYIIFGGTLASVSGANVPNPATVNAVAANLITASVGICLYLPATQTKSYKLWLGKPTTDGSLLGGASPCRFMSFVTKAGTAILRVHMSSELR